MTQTIDNGCTTIMSGNQSSNMIITSHNGLDRVKDKCAPFICFTPVNQIRKCTNQKRHSTYTVVSHVRSIENQVDQHMINDDDM